MVDIEAPIFGKEEEMSFPEAKPPEDGSKPSTINWAIIHIMIPLVPFFLIAMIRMIIYQKINWNSFDASELSFSLGFTAAFIAESLHLQDITNESASAKETRKRDEYITLVISFTFITLFFLVEVFSSMADLYKLQGIFGSLRSTKVIVFTLTVALIYYAFKMQRKHELKASFL